MRKIINMSGNTYEIDDYDGSITNIQTGVQCERVWAYPVRQAVWGGVPETYYFGSAAARDQYMAQHDYCDKQPRCKVMSDMIIK